MAFVLSDALVLEYAPPTPPVEPIEPIPPAPISPSYPTHTIPRIPLGGPYPLNHARILWRNVLQFAAADPVGASVATTPATWERYTVATATTVTYTVGVAFDFDSVGIAAHTFGSTGTELEIWYSTAASGESFVKIYDAIPQDDGAIFVQISSVVDARRIRLVIGDPDTTVEVGVVFAGAALQMQRPIYGGHRPITLSSNTQYANSISDSGQWLGRSITKRGYKTQGNWKYTEAEWVRLYLAPFIEGAKLSPFFFAWNPLEYPLEVGYCWTDSDITPVNMGKRDLMEFSISMEAYGV
jgi:hypothetical protein